MPQQAAVHLAGNRDQGDAVRVRRGKRGDQVRGSRPGAGDTDRGFPCDARVSGGCVPRGLFLPHQHMLNLRILIERLIEWGDRHARDSEDLRDSLCLQAFHHGLCTVHILCPVLSLQMFLHTSVPGLHIQAGSSLSQMSFFQHLFRKSRSNCCMISLTQK